MTHSQTQMGHVISNISTGTVLFYIFIATRIWHDVMTEVQHYMFETYCFLKAKLTKIKRLSRKSAML